MKVDSDYFESPAHHFSMKHPNFWKILRKFTFNYDDFIYIYETVTTNIANFSPTSIATISYCFDLYIQHANANDQVDVSTKIYRIHDRIKYAQIRANMLHDIIIKNIGTEFKHIENSHVRIKCPYNYYINDMYEYSDIYDCFIYYNNSVKRGHFYVMLYVFDLTLRMQKIKSEIIKYELSRKGRHSGTIIDILVDENFLY